jgi:hypothetical protein
MIKKSHWISPSFTEDFENPDGPIHPRSPAAASPFTDCLIPLNDQRRIGSSGPSRVGLSRITFTSKIYIPLWPRAAPVSRFYEYKSDGKSKLIRAAGTYRMQPPFGMPSYIFHSEPARRKLIHTLAVLIFNVLNTLKETVKYLVATYAYFTLRLHKTFPRERSRLTIDPNYQTRLSPASRAGSGRSNPICRQKNYLCFDRKQFRSSL